jgi:hypothetical protein
VHHADAQRADRLDHPMPMSMIFLSLVAVQVNVRGIIMIVVMHMPSFTVQLCS